MFLAPVVLYHAFLWSPFQLEEIRYTSPAMGTNVLHLELVTQSVTLLVEPHSNLFATYFRCSRIRGKAERVYTVLP